MSKILDVRLFSRLVNSRALGICFPRQSSFSYAHPSRMFCVSMQQQKEMQVEKLSVNAKTSSGSSQRPARQRKAVITVSERAAARVAELMGKKEPRPLGLRLGVRTRGCNGLSYTMNYVDAVPKNDDVVESNGVKIFVDPKAVMYLLGCRMDFVEDAVKAEFVFENPNAKGSCGCGESFNV